MTPLLSVPNISEGRDKAQVHEMAEAFGPGVLDVHSDPDHHRSVITLAGEPGELAARVAHGARAVVERIDVSAHAGAHPRIGALDVAPIVYLEGEDRGAAAAEALVLGDLLGELGIPVFLYGPLARGRTRAEVRRGGPRTLADRISTGELVPDFGPPRPHPTAGATLVAARPPLVAFNVELAPPANLAQAKEIAAKIRETGPEGLPSVRAIGVWLERRGVAQVSTNIEDHRRVSLADVIAAVVPHAAVAEAELVGLAPREALRDFPPDVALSGRRTIEETLTTSD